MRARRYIRLVPLLGMLAIEPAWPQATVSLSGTVSDSTGAVMPGATVNLTNEATRATRTTTTGAEGAYTFPQLPPGTYSLEFTKAGFKTAVRHNVVLPVGTHQILDVALPVGELVEQVVVESSAVPVNTTDASVGNPFSEAQVRQLPLEARNPSQLLSLQAGVVWAGERNLNDERTGSVFGGRGNQGNITLDGADVNDNVNQSAMQSVLPIPLDSVQEFRVTTLGGGAQYGRSSGAQVELVTKSGSNHWHGSAYWYHRNELFSSNGFFENRLGIPKAPLKRHIFGSSAGGPLKRDRVFFFLNWESRRDATATPQTRVVPTDSFRDGVLMYPCASAGACPSSAVAGLTSTHTVPAGWYGLTPTQIAKAVDPCGSTTCIDPFGRTINPGVNPNIIALYKGYPHGNDPSLGAINGLDNGFNAIGYRFAPPITVNNNDYVARFDFNLDPSGKHTLFWRGTLADDQRINQPQQFPLDPLTGNPGAPASVLLNNSKGMAVSYTGQLSPTLINTFRYGFTRQGVDSGGVAGTAYLTRGFDRDRSVTRAGVRLTPTHTFQDDMTWVRGKHSLQFGFVGRYITEDRQSFANSFESFSSNNGWTTTLGRFCVLPGRASTTCPNAAALNALPTVAGSFQSPYARLTEDILGIITQAGAVTFQFDLNGKALPFGSPQVREFVTQEYEGYLQDTVRLRSNLTLTLGARYNFSTVPYEKHGLQVIPDVDLGNWFAKRQSDMEQGIPSSASPLISFRPGGKVNHAPGWFDPDTNNLAPRASLAYSPSFKGGPGKVLFGGPGKSSIRGGFSLAYDRLSGGLMGLLANQSEVGLATSITSAFGKYDYADNPVTGAKAAFRFAGYDKFPASGEPFFTTPQGGFPALAIQDSNQYGAGIVGSLHTPYSMQFDFSIGREFGKGMIVEVGYVGRQGRDLLVQGDFAQWLRFRDPASRMNIWEAFNQLEKGIHSLTLAYDGPCAAKPNSCPVIPFFENVYSGMASYWGKQTGTTFTSNTAAMADYAVQTNAPDWGDLIKALDVLPLTSGLSVYNPKFDPQGTGRLVFPQQYTVLGVWTNTGSSFYNGFVVSLRRRAGNLQFDANYVYSKSIDDGSALEGESSFYNGINPDNFDGHTYRGFSNFDVRHNFNANWLYQVPIGKGKRLGSGVPGWADQILGNWQVSGVWRWRSGFPVGVANGFWFPTTWDVSGTATQVAPVASNIQKGASGGPNLFTNPVDTKANNPFDASGTAYGAFVHTPMGGSGSRNNLRAGQFFTIDLGLGKSFRMPWEGHRLQLRWEIFNLTNSVNFGSGGGDLSLNLDAVSSFGRIINAASSASQSYPLVPHNRVMQLGLRYEF